MVLANSPIVNPSRAAYQVADAFFGKSLGPVEAAPPAAPKASLQLSAASARLARGNLQVGTRLVRRRAPHGNGAHRAGDQRGALADAGSDAK